MTGRTATAALAAALLLAPAVSRGDAAGAPAPLPTPLAATTPSADRDGPGAGAAPPSGLADLAKPAPREVYRLSLAVDIPIAAVSLVGAALPAIFADRWIDRRCAVTACNPAEVNGFDRPTIGNSSSVAATFSDVTVVAAVLAPPLLDLADVGWNRVLFQDVAVFAETLLVNAAIVEIVKVTVQRPLPLTYSGDPSVRNSNEGYRSFYSGHTSTTVAALAAAAMTLRLRYRELYWPWAVVGVVGASVGVERVYAGRHFPTDVIVGGVAGLAIGVVVPWLHAWMKDAGVSLAPASAGQGLAIVGRF